MIRIFTFEGGTRRAQQARDCAFLSFCLIGMNSVDMYNAYIFKNGYICYNRTKTKERRSDDAYIEVKVQPFIEELARKYRGKKRVFRFYEMYSSDKDFNRALNIGLKKIGEEVGIDGLSFYQARHTFATLSRNLMRFSKSDVDEALNHVGGMELADVYIAKDFSIINDNNAKLLEKVFKEGATALTGNAPK
jgi:integrase